MLQVVYKSWLGISEELLLFISSHDKQWHFLTVVDFCFSCGATFFDFSQPFYVNPCTCIMRQKEEKERVSCRMPRLFFIQKSEEYFHKSPSIERCSSHKEKEILLHMPKETNIFPKTVRPITNGKQALQSTLSKYDFTFTQSFLQKYKKCKGTNMRNAFCLRIPGCFRVQCRHCWD